MTTEHEAPHVPNMYTLHLGELILALDSAEVAGWEP